jgi:hypothetical protein
MATARSQEQQRQATARAQKKSGTFFLPSAYCSVVKERQKRATPREMNRKTVATFFLRNDPESKQLNQSYSQLSRAEPSMQSSRAEQNKSSRPRPKFKSSQAKASTGIESIPTKAATGIKWISMKAAAGIELSPTKTTGGAKSIQTRTKTEGDHSRKNRW